MVKQGVNKLRVIALAGLAVFALASAPAKAHQDYNYVAPLAAIIAIGALVHHGHHRHYGHYRPQAHYYHPRHRHSDSHGRYQGPKRKHYQRW